MKASFVLGGATVYCDTRFPEDGIRHDSVATHRRLISCTRAIALVLAFPAFADAQSNALNATGNVGVGTTTPSARIDIVTPANPTGRVRAFSALHTMNNTVQIDQFGTAHPTRPQWNLLSVSNESQGLGFVVDNQTAIDAGTSLKGLFIQTGGRVGIGKISPFAKFDVEGRANFGTGASQSSFLAPETQVQVLTDANVPNVISQWQSGVALTHMGQKANDSRLYLTNSYDGSSFGTASRSVVLDANGNLGVGVVDPQGKLDVSSGSAIFAKMVDARGLHDLAPASAVSISGGSLSENGLNGHGPNDYWFVTGTGQSATLDFGQAFGVQYISFGTFWREDSRNIPLNYTIHRSLDGVNWILALEKTGNGSPSPVHQLGVNARYLRLTVTAFQSGQTTANIAGLQVLTPDAGAGYGSGRNAWSLGNGSSNVFLTTLGNVGIGTKSPTHKLSVNGTVRAKEVIVETTGWSDYVLAPDYKLPTLAETEQHIIEHGHLPGIPSAAEVAENGVTLGDFQAKLLAKFEEMTLHQIALEKRVAQLERENEALRNQTSAPAAP